MCEGIEIFRKACSCRSSPLCPHFSFFVLSNAWSGYVRILGGIVLFFVLCLITDTRPPSACHARCSQLVSAICTQSKGDVRITHELMSFKCTCSRSDILRIACGRATRYTGGSDRASHEGLCRASAWSLLEHLSIASKPNYDISCGPPNPLGRTKRNDLAST